MLCEKCQAKPAKVHIERVRGGSGEALSTPVDHHFCEDCARDFIQSDPKLKIATWSKPTLHFKLNVTPDTKPPGDSPGNQHHDR